MIRAGALAAFAMLALPAAADNPPPASLEGPVWVLTHLGEAPFGAAAHLRFSRDDTGQTVTGEGPCNMLSGGWTGAPTGGAVTVGPLAATMRACEDMEAEGLFFVALDAVREARLEGAVLTLSGPDAPALRFEAAESPPPRN